MALSDREWTTKLTEAVSSAVPDIFGKDACLASNEPERIDRRYSFMFRYRVESLQAGTHTVLVKIPHESWMQTMDEAITSEHIRDVTQGEYDVMTSIANVIDSSNVPGLFAIRPGACFPELGALLVEEYPLRMLKTSLTSIPIVFGVQKAWVEFEDQLERAGIWLRVIHTSFGDRQTTPLSNLGIQVQLESEFEIIEKILNSRSLPALRTHFQSLFASLQTSEIPLASLHNDYHLGNVFVMKDGRVGVIDPNWVEREPIYEDLSSLLIDPVTRKQQVMSLGLTFRPSLYKRYEDAVLRGYFGDVKVPHSLIYFYSALDSLVKWRMNEEVLNESGSILHTILSALIKPYMRFYFQRLIKNFLEKAQAAWKMSEKNL
jgi:thiamine kinase-like enzyme